MIDNLCAQVIPVNSLFRVFFGKRVAYLGGSSLSEIVFAYISIHSFHWFFCFFWWGIFSLPRISSDLLLQQRTLFFSRCPLQVNKISCTLKKKKRWQSSNSKPSLRAKAPWKNNYCFSSSFKKRPSLRAEAPQKND